MTVQTFPTVPPLLLFQSSKSCLWHWPAEKGASGLSVQDPFFEIAHWNTKNSDLCEVFIHTKHAAYFAPGKTRVLNVSSKWCCNWQHWTLNFSYWFIGHQTHFTHVKTLVITARETIQLADTHFFWSVPSKDEFWHETGRICDGGICLHTFMNLKFNLVYEAFLTCCLLQSHP